MILLGIDYSACVYVRTTSRGKVHKILKNSQTFFFNTVDRSLLLLRTIQTLSLIIIHTQKKR